jgi:hypothetical protein
MATAGIPTLTCLSLTAPNTSFRCNNIILMLVGYNNNVPVTSNEHIHTSGYTITSEGNVYLQVLGWLPAATSRTLLLAVKVLPFNVSHWTPLDVWLRYVHKCMYG